MQSHNATVQAMQQTSGVQRRQYERWRKTLLSCLAHVEAVIDFGDDNDIESGVAEEVLPVVHALKVELQGHLEDSETSLNFWKSMTSMQAASQKSVGWDSYNVYSSMFLLCYVSRKSELQLHREWWKQSYK